MPPKRKSSYTATATTTECTDYCCPKKKHPALSTHPTVDDAIHTNLPEPSRTRKTKQVMPTRQLSDKSKSEDSNIMSSDDSSDSDSLGELLA